MNWLRRRPIKKRWQLLILALVSLVLALSAGWLITANQADPSVADLPEITDLAGEWSLIELQTQIEAGDVAAITARREVVESASAGQTKPLIVVALAREPADQTYRILSSQNVARTLGALETLGYGDLISEEAKWLTAEPAAPGVSLLSMLILGFVIVLFIMFLRRSGSRGVGRAGARAGVQAEVDPDVALDDVAGCNEAKLELTEVIEFLRNPKRFVHLGAKMPRGVLLYGPPGTGKTMLAKAIAHEVGVPFIFVSASEFVEMFVGVGASRIRQVFADARKRGAGIIFIDEIDAIGKARGGPNSHDEREQALNQLLVELDGFAANERIIVIGATNRLDVLDQALLRPGRFTRKVHVGYPDIAGRRSILAVHARGKPLTAEADLEAIARKTGRMTGAQLADLMNEAAIMAARKGATEITNDDLHRGMIKSQVGTSRTRSMDDRERAIIAVHETGHALAGRLHGSKRKIEEISLFAHGDALGVTIYSQEDNDLPSESDVRASLVALMGGKAAEDLFFSEATPGASDDFQKATDLARLMVTRWGMGSDPLDRRQGPAGRGDLSFIFSEGEVPTSMVASVNRAMATILDDAYSAARQTLLNHLERFWLVATYLFDNERMGGESFEELFSGRSSLRTDFSRDWRPANARPRSLAEVMKLVSAAPPSSGAAIPPADSLKLLQRTPRAREHSRRSVRSVWAMARRRVAETILPDAGPAETFRRR